MRPGSLLMFTSGVFQEAYTFLLGVVLERPSVHTLMGVNLLGNDEVGILLTEGLPSILTERQLFQELLARAGSQSVRRIDVEVWQCQTFLRGPGSQLYATPDKQLCNFNLTEKAEQKSKKVSVELPFGLQPAKRARRSNATAKARPRKPRGASRSKPADEVIDLEAAGGISVSDEDSADSISESEQEPEAESLANAEDESEHLAPLNGTAASEEACLPQLERELNMEETMREQAAEAIRSARPGPGRSSFFAKELGLAEGALAASGRSVCLNCKMPIKKDTVRFSWYHSLYRPPGWVHSACVCELVKATGLREVAIRRLSEIRHQGGSASSSSRTLNAASEVADMAAQLHDALLSMPQHGA